MSSIRPQPVTGEDAEALFFLKSRQEWIVGGKAPPPYPCGRPLD